MLFSACKDPHQHAYTFLRLARGIADLRSLPLQHLNTPTLSVDSLISDEICTEAILAESIAGSLIVGGTLAEAIAAGPPCPDRPGPGSASPGRGLDVLRPHRNAPVLHSAMRSMRRWPLIAAEPQGGLPAAEDLAKVCGGNSCARTELSDVSGALATS